MSLKELSFRLYPSNVSNWIELVNKNIIDIGCGPHKFLIYSNHDKMIENNEVISVDYGNYVKPSIPNYFKADAYHLPFITSHFDFAILSRVCSSDISRLNVFSEKIERHVLKQVLRPLYSNDLSKILKEVNRILKNGGFIYLEVNTGWCNDRKRNHVKTTYVNALGNYGFNVLAISLLSDLYIIAQKMKSI